MTILNFYLRKVDPQADWDSEWYNGDSSEHQLGKMMEKKDPTQGNVSEFQKAFKIGINCYWSKVKFNKSPRLLYF